MEKKSLVSSMHHSYFKSFIKFSLFLQFSLAFPEFQKFTDNFNFDIDDNGSDKDRSKNEEEQEPEKNEGVSGLVQEGKVLDFSSKIKQCHFY
jgi:hypothetical protein